MSHNCKFHHAERTRIVGSANKVIELDSRLQPTYYYHLKDHLGNVRAVVSPGTNNTTVVNQTNEYYPFGMAYTKTGGSLLDAIKPNKYKFNGKEEQEMPGKWLDYGARFLDVQLGRWHSIDPMSEVARRWSPYQYAYNNPIRFIDPDGMMSIDPPWKSWYESGTYSETTVNRSNTKINVTTFSYDPQTGGNSNTSTITGSSSNIKNVSDKSATVIGNSMTSAGESDVEVSSTYREPESQASAMYDNAVTKGAESQRNLYNSAGDKVVDTYENNSPEWNCSKAEAVNAMTQTINEQGPGNVSAHSSDPKVLNVIDIAPSSITDTKKFHNALHNNGGINKVITPIDKPGEGAFHLEIKQK
jgi:RHS repeat-associated protein